MARKLHDEALAYIKREAIAGTNGRAIHRALVGGQADELNPIQISERRVQQLRTDFIRAAKDDLEAIDPASLDTAFQTERAMLLVEVRRRRKVASRLPDTSTKAIDLMTKIARFLATIDQHYTGKQAKDPQRVSAGLTPDKKTTLELLGETMDGPAPTRPHPLSTPTSNGGQSLRATNQGGSGDDNGNDRGIGEQGQGQSLSHSHPSIPA